MSNVNVYNGLKTRYRAIDYKRKGLTFGDYRSFVNLKNWERESEYLGSGMDKYKAHTGAFEETLNFIERNGKKEIQENILKSSKTWRDRDSNVEYYDDGPRLLFSPIESINKINPNGKKMVSLFSGAMGLDLGFIAAGFELVLANDISADSKNTVLENLPDTSFIHQDIADVRSEEIMSFAGIDAGEVDVLVGGPPCQPFSTAGLRKGFNDPRASPLREFIRVIKDIRPKAFVMEEVTGLLSARLKHISIKDRNERGLQAEEEKGTVFKVIREMLDSTGYRYWFDVVNAADFGSPQQRKRLIIIGMRDKLPGPLVPTHSAESRVTLFGDQLKPWNTFWEATVDLQGTKMTHSNLSEKRANLMDLVVPGGNWRHLPEDIIEQAMGGAYKSGGGKMGYYRRLSWDDPSPTVVTSPSQNSTMFCHPYLTRPLSVEEYKRVQGFPDDWTITGNLAAQYKQIGDAVPVHLSYEIAKRVIALLDKE